MRRREIVYVISYPDNQVRLRETIQAVEDLKKALRSQHELDLESFDFIDLRAIEPQVAQFLDQVVGASLHQKNCLSSRALFLVLWALKEPEFIAAAKASFGCEAQEFWHYIETPSPTELVPWPLFVALDNKLHLCANQGATNSWGECYYDEYPTTVAIERTGQRESIFHEFLHQLGVSEGYDPLSSSKPPCDPACWMQYVSTKGKGLCGRHRAELEQFLVRLGS